MKAETIERIAERVKRLTPDQQEKVLQFVEDLGPRPRSLSEAVRDLVENIPKDVLGRLPKDGATNHDHYLYGVPKK